MSEITHQNAQRAAMLLTASIKTVTFYPQAHPAVRQPLEELAALFDGMFEVKKEIRLGVVEGVFFLEGNLFVTPNSSVAELAERLIGKELHAFTIVQGVTTDDLFQFASLLARKNLAADQIFEELARKGIVTIRQGIEEIVDGDGEDEQSLSPARTYHDALNAVRGTMKDIENGRIPASDRIYEVVDNMVSLAIKDHTTLLGLAMIKDYDNYTFNHSVNVGILAVSLAAYLGMDREMLRDTNTAGLLHDIGKIRIEKSILNKPGKLSGEEYEEMKKHAEKGAEIVQKMEDIHSRVVDAVLGHHIRYNRTGYPEWARSREFDLMTDILAVADCYDAITTLRVYNSPVLPKAALDVLRRISGTSLSADLVDKFEEMMGEYPVGTLVRLDTNEIALVVRPHPLESKEASVKIIIDADGTALENPRLLSLSDCDGKRYASIVALVDPLVKNIDVSRYFLM
ncbi:MAG TPA: HD-GYP domain-containing protein [Geobacteraceae bacterium]|nr:HD-GYP domain-containing protein [Geobacteraceae bacterium]